MEGDDAIIGTGILLQAGDGANPENFVTFAELVSIKLPQLSRNEVDVSLVSADRDNKLLGMLRRGQITGLCNLLPLDPSHQAMLQDILDNVKRNWRIVLPASAQLNGQMWTMPARVQLFDIQELAPDTPLQVAFAMTIAKGDIIITPEG